MPGLAHFFGKVGGPPADAGPELTEVGLARRVMLQQRNLVHEFIAGTAVDSPIAVQLLAAAEDFLDKNGKVFERGG
ncbi:hypothetical protein D9M73_177750 [compost metagenome]